MSKEVVSLRVDDRTQAAINRVKEDYDDSQARAAERAVNHGLERMGYLESGQTPLETVCGEVTQFAMYAALVTAIIVLATPATGLLELAVGLFATGAVTWAVKMHEPAVTRFLRRVRA